MKVFFRMFRKLKDVTMSPTERADRLKQDGLEIGEHCEVYPNVTFGTEPYLIRIGNHVRITSDVKFITHDGGVWVLRELTQDNSLDLFGKIVVGNNVMIGTRAMIMPNVKIGDNCIIAAGAVVTRDVPPGSVVGGVPARLIESIHEYLDKNDTKWASTKGMSRKEKEEFLKKTLCNDENRD